MSHPFAIAANLVMGFASMFGVALVAAVIVPESLDAARRRHRIVCRQAFRVRAAAEFVCEAALGWCFAWALSIPWPGRIVMIGIQLTASAVRDVQDRRTGTQVPDGWLGRVWIAHAHRDHEDDCEYGPKHRRDGFLAKLRTWRKVALNPAFSPT